MGRRGVTTGAFVECFGVLSLFVQLLERARLLFACTQRSNRASAWVIVGCSFALFVPEKHS